MSDAKYYYRQVVEFSRTNSISIAATAIFLLALALRVWGIRFGLPNLYHPDEWAIVDRSLAMMRTGDYNPREFGYPSLYMYMELLTFVLYFFYGVSKGVYASLSGISASDFYLWGRFLTAFLGALTVYVVYLTGRQLFGSRAGLLAALFLALSFLHARDSHYITVDVPATFFVGLSLFFAARILNTGKVFDYSMSGFFAGAAIATKWNAFPVTLSFIAAYMLFSIDSRRWDGKIFYGFLFLAIGLFVGTPFAFLDLPVFLGTLGNVLFHYQQGHPGFEASKPYLFYLKNLASSEGMGPTVFLMVFLGLVLSLLRHRRQDILPLVFPAAYFLFISRSKVTFPRNALPLYAVMPLYGGVFLASTSDFLENTLGKKNRILAVAALCVIVTLATALPLARVIQFDYASVKIDNRTLCARWIERNLPKGSKIAAEFYGPPISGDFEVMKFPFLGHSPDWFREQEFDYIVFDSADYGRFFEDPDRYPQEVKAYQDLFREGTLLKDFPEDNWVEKFLSPAIKIYKIP